jgi:hypothetical protein
LVYFVVIRYFCGNLVYFVALWSVAGKWIPCQPKPEPEVGDPQAGAGTYIFYSSPFRPKSFLQICIYPKILVELWNLMQAPPPPKKKPILLQQLSLVRNLRLKQIY